MQVDENGSKPATKNQTTAERKSDRELVITRTFNAPATIVFDAWTKPELVMRWWAPRSMGMKLVACEVDLRVGGKYRYVFAHDGKEVFTAFGKYTLVERPTRLAWTDEDLEATGEATSTLTLDEKNGKTTLSLRAVYPSKEALDDAISSGAEPCSCDQLDQLDELLAATSTSD